MKFTMTGLEKKSTSSRKLMVIGRTTMLMDVRPALVAMSELDFDGDEDV